MGDYESQIQLGSCIGRGHFSDVHEGTDALGEKVAIKILRPLAGETAGEFAAREQELLAEGRRLAGARHEHVVQVKDVVRHLPSGRVLLVTEFCPGGSVHTRYEAGPIPLLEVRNLATQMAQGLEAVHARGMIHRDIKPGNVLLGANGEAKLADFGLVTDRIILGYASDQGYEDHLAPEVFKDHVTSRRTDFWAFGMTIYRLLHGEAWYRSVGQRARPRDLVPLGGFAGHLEWLPHIPDGWRRFVRRCMHDKPERRYEGAQGLLEGLASLPVEPNWTCAVGPAEVTWHRTASPRRQRVRWETLSPQRHTWCAESAPAKGKWRTFRRCQVALGRRQVERELTEFFESGAGTDPK